MTIEMLIESLEAVSKLEIVRQNKARVDRAGLGVPLVYMPIHEQRRAACKATRPACAGCKINFEMASSV